MKVWESRLPAREFKAGVRRVMRRELKRMRAETVRRAAKESNFKQKFLRHLSGVSIKGFRGVFWMVTRDHALHRIGEPRYPKGKRARSDAPFAIKRALRRRTSANIRTFIIGKRLLIRRAGQIKHFFVNVAQIFKVGWWRIVSDPHRQIDKALHREMNYRLNKIIGAARK